LKVLMLICFKSDSEIPMDKYRDDGVSGGRLAPGHHRAPGACPPKQQW
jgi:hypothetical protein